ncbi:MAG: arginine--tRNA ligase [Deltaproteobacteria bacterium]|nr:MAG: arginine--tRNA ligase [Deltaproteobacteria bacterium]
MQIRIAHLIHAAIARGIEEGALPKGTLVPIEEIGVMVPRQKEHGDFSSNIAFILARRARRPPLEIGPILAGLIREIGDPTVASVTFLPPGFLNFSLARGAWFAFLEDLHRQGAAYGTNDLGKGERVNIEFVSVNPTGPVHVGHGRNAAVGDALARVLSACGYAVTREYYINDAGNQMNLLARSVHARYLELLGRSVAFPEDGYHGAYIREIARALLERDGTKWVDRPQAEWLPVFRTFAREVCLREIKSTMQAFRVSFDVWTSEQSLHDRGAITACIDRLQAAGKIYEKDGALWFRSSDYGDEKDRVVRRANGELTYLAADIAYHEDKFQRGFDTLIDVWGADHHGYIPRMKAAVAALGHDPDAFVVLLIQLVHLKRGEELVPMSKRAGELITLQDVIDEVGVDAARYFFLTKHTDTTLDFDLELAKRKDRENPVYYVQYVHARICQIIRKAYCEATGVTEREAAAIPLAEVIDRVIPPYDAVELERLTLPEEIDVIKALQKFPTVVAGAGRRREPHRITNFLQEMASAFHFYYTAGTRDATKRVLCPDPALQKARLFLVAAVRIVLANAFTLLGISAPERM